MMKRLILVFIVMLHMTLAHALEASAAGTYAIVHADGHVTDKVFRVTTSANRWRLEDRKPNGTWSDVTCEKDCELRETSSENIRRMFTKSQLVETTPNCVNNMAFAFCSYSLKSSPSTTEYVLMVLVTNQPTQIKLLRIKSNA